MLPLRMEGFLLQSNLLKPYTVGSMIILTFMIAGEMHSKFSILSAVVVDLDELEGFILAQSPETQKKIRNKIRRLKDELGKEMTLEYARNYVKEHC